MINSQRICIQVQSMYIDKKSQPENNRYVFAYTITLRNLGRKNVHLISRYWLITNSNGQETKIQGKGVVGEQPIIKAGEEFQYTSGAILETPLGIMQGHYQMIDHEGEEFHIYVPIFRLASPKIIN